MAVPDKSNEKNNKDRQEPPVIKTSEVPKEYGGPKGPEPTRYGDWEKNGRCIDF